jgi:hypothetical protein
LGAVAYADGRWINQLEEVMKKFVAWVAAVVLAGALVVTAEDSKKSESVQLEGKIGCSRCAFHTANSCGVGFKTADGKIYNLIKPKAELVQARHGSGTLKVTGTVTEKDGKLFVAATKTELTK